MMPGSGDLCICLQLRPLPSLRVLVSICRSEWSRVPDAAGSHSEIMQSMLMNVLLSLLADMIADNGQAVHCKEARGMLVSCFQYLLF